MAKIYTKINLKKTVAKMGIGDTVELPMAEVYYNSLTAALTRECGGGFSDFFSTDSKTKEGYYLVTRLK